MANMFLQSLDTLMQGSAAIYTEFKIIFQKSDFTKAGVDVWLGAVANYRRIVFSNELCANDVHLG